MPDTKNRLTENGSERRFWYRKIRKLGLVLRIGFDLRQWPFFNDFEYGARTTCHRLGFVRKRRHKRGIRFDLFETGFGQILREILGNVCNGFDFNLDFMDRFYSRSVVYRSLTGRRFGYKLRCLFDRNFGNLFFARLINRSESRGLFCGRHSMDRFDCGSRSGHDCGLGSIAVGSG